jgi:hypothetical protein
MSANQVQTVMVFEVELDEDKNIPFRIDAEATTTGTVLNSVTCKKSSSHVLTN